MPMAAGGECGETDCRQESYSTILLRRGALWRTRRGISSSRLCLVWSTAIETWYAAASTAADCDMLISVSYCVCTL